MKTIIILVLLFPIFAFAQIPSDSLVKNYKLNFALPDNPAFKALGTEPSNILRPSVAQDFSFVSSEFFNGKNLVIPDSFGVEVSPILLMNTEKMTLSDFRKHNVFKTSRFSLGTFKDSLKTRNISLGYRITVINKGDLRTDTKVLNEFLVNAEERAKKRAELMKRFMFENKLVSSNLTKDDIQRMEDYVNLNIDETEEEFENRLEEFKKQYKNNNWNAQKLDFAAAIVGQSPDSLLSNVSFRNLSVWGTYAIPIKKFAQILLGMNYQLNSIQDKDYHSISLSNRNYFGSNRIKFFFEEQLKYDKFLGEKTNLLLNVGAEANLNKGFWIDLNAGLTKNYNNNTSDFVSQLRFRYTLPE
ncbi:hypothetical protein [Chryseobacterium taiwanense]|uniref:Uncharacterized protein n=1 Tax=Chryseobacterium taiwanense TaxID=363331 RepID=A0A0B4CV43_9FLAO|nr:hypothetical protein [Chryseobacterium taiwanense]KIC65089.1 hypothetical protein RM51_01160 [Chryseobacterium taiwanense]